MVEDKDGGDQLSIYMNAGSGESRAIDDDEGKLLGDGGVGPGSGEGHSHFYLHQFDISQLINGYIWYLVFNISEITVFLSTHVDHGFPRITPVFIPVGSECTESDD